MSKAWFPLFDLKTLSFFTLLTRKRKVEYYSAIIFLFIFGYILKWRKTKRDLNSKYLRCKHHKILFDLKIIDNIIIMYIIDEK